MSSMSEEQEITKDTEQKIDVSVEEEKVSVAPETESNGDELETYSRNVQSRIKKLTEKYRQEERDREEAVKLSQHLMKENQSLKAVFKRWIKGIFRNTEIELRVRLRQLNKQ